MAKSRLSETLRENLKGNLSKSLSKSLEWVGGREHQRLRIPVKMLSAEISSEEENPGTHQLWKHLSEGTSPKAPLFTKFGHTA